MTTYTLYTGADLVGRYTADELAGVIAELTESGDVVLRIVRED